MLIRVFFPKTKTCRKNEIIINPSQAIQTIPYLIKKAKRLCDNRESVVTAQTFFENNSNGTVCYVIGPIGDLRNSIKLTFKLSNQSFEKQNQGLYNFIKDLKALTSLKIQNHTAKRYLYLAVSSMLRFKIFPPHSPSGD